MECGSTGVEAWRSAHRIDLKPMFGDVRNHHTLPYQAFPNNNTIPPMSHMWAQCLTIAKVAWF